MTETELYIYTINRKFLLPKVQLEDVLQKNFILPPSLSPFFALQ